MTQEKTILEQFWKDSYNELLGRYVKEVVALESEAKRWKAWYTCNEAEMKKLESQLEQCQTELRDSREEVRGLMAKIAESDERMGAVLDTELDETTGLIKAFDIERKELNARIEKAEALLEGANDLLAELEDEDPLDGIGLTD